MSHRVSALYHDLEKARLAAGDLQFSGVLPERIVLANGIASGSARIEVIAHDMDQAIDLKTFLEGDGALSVEIQDGEDKLTIDTMPTVPAP